MSPALPVVKARDCLRALRRAGFYIHHATGSHARLFHRTKPGLRVTVPLHAGDLPLPTLKNILRQARMSTDDFIKLL